jgi:mono/diheme cytochrome c family protein
MNRAASILLITVLFLTACARKAASPASASPTAYGSALVVSSGDKQVAAVGALLVDPVIVQVNDASGNGVAGAPVWFESASGSVIDPGYALTDSSGQVTANVNLGAMAGHCEIKAYTRDSSGKRIDLAIDEIALGYEQQVGRILSDQYCARCHNPESTAERVSNFDNLATKPHPFTEGEALNKMTDDDLIAIISHGGPALNKSAEMPPFGYTLKKKEVEALAAYIRFVADPPYQRPGVVNAKAQ